MLNLLLSRSLALAGGGCLLWLATAVAVAQSAEPAPSEQPTAPATAPAAAAGRAAPQDVAAPGHLLLAYPRDKDRVVAEVGERPITLGELVRHLDERHHPGFEQALRERPEVQRMLQSDLLAPWVRHYADLKALQHLMREKPIDAEQLEEKQSAALKRMFEGWLETYVARRQELGQPTELSQQLVNRLLTDFQLRSGISAELQGMLDLLEPDDYTRGQLQEFFQAFPRFFGGTITVAHILIHHRDPGTGILWDNLGMAKAAARLADIRARLRKDGSNFEEVARLFSADSKTAAEGGLLGPVYRFDDRLPAMLCRAAWDMRDGEVSDVIETPYGWHILKRLEYDQKIYILFTDDAIPSIRIVMQRARQEELMFRARELAKLALRV